MPATLAPLFVLVAGCFLLGVSTPRHWQDLDSGRLTGRRQSVVGLGLALLCVSAAGFIVELGAEVGLAWFILWLGLATVAATLWLSYWPKRAPWVGFGCCAVALLSWAVG